MIHKGLIVVVLASILYVVYASLNQLPIYLWVLFVMALSAALYYVTTSVVTKGMVNKKEGKNALSYKAGLVDKTNLIPGRLYYDSQKIVFYKRAGDLGGLSESFNIKVEDLKSYSVGQINEYQKGIKLTTKGKHSRTYEVKCKEIIENENLFASTIGWSLDVGEEE